VFDIFAVLLRLVPQVLALEAALKAKGGHGTYELDLDVKDTSTGQDIIAGVEVATITF